ncbi:MAG: homocysteine S-methyltransferase family protein [Flavobacteriales bacterium]|nr:homocysteine S-methyltransferase family protein [Flavobacteriales bacterium]
MALIQQAINKKILILDGAMGTMIQKAGVTRDDFYNAELQNHPVDLQGNNDLLSITKPEVIQDIHEAYLEAGADIIETNTFSSTSIAQADYELEHLAYQLNVSSAKIARAAADKFTAKTPNQPRFVAGSIGPTNRTASMSPDVNNPAFRAVSFEELKDAYLEQVKGLAEGGVDLFLVETVFDTLNAKAALVAIEEFHRDSKKIIPIMVSGTITDASGRTLSGQTAEAFYISLSHAPMLTIGFNCALGTDQLRPHIETLSGIATCGISAHPNAGLPNELGEYDESMASQIETYLQNGWINIIGGCCGTTPDHIKAISEVATKYSPRNAEVNV